MLWKIALTIISIWVLAGVIGAAVKSIRMRIRFLTGVTVFCVAVLAYYLWLG
jgi:hypothetical protein